MTAIAGIASRDAVDAARLRPVLLAMHALGADGVESWAPTGGSAPVALGASAHGWENALLRRNSPLAKRGSLAVAADATLYHRDDLLRALGGPAADSAPPASRLDDAALILAAFERWDLEAFSRLEGDFAVVIWDGTRERLVAARDFGGHRGLFHATVGSSVLVASSVAGLLADASVPRDVDLAAVATVAAGLWGHSPRTAYRAIEELPAGHTLTWSRGGRPVVAPFWNAPEQTLHRRQPAEESAAELRALLVDAVRERLAPSGPTAVSLSGGWDSTAVGAAATVALRGDATRRMQPVSISYPEGDPGREDELIRDVVSHWGTTTSWLPVDEIPLFSDPERSAAARDLPFAHAFEHWNRALSRRARECGARVVLDGVGGDQLFQVSDIYLSDLFARGQWVELARQWRGRDGHGLRNFWRWAVRPALPDAISHTIARLRGVEPPRHHFHREPPHWFSPRFLEAHGVLDRDEAATPVLPRSDRVLGETHAYLRFPFFPRIMHTLHRFAIEEGVELRSPLLDDRVVRFAARRPWSERVDRRETKLLLRRAMTGLIPAHVLAPRPHRTGITSAYFLRQMRGAGRPLVESLLQDSLLGSLGMIDLPRLRHAWAYLLAHENDELGARVFFTLQAELWLRAHSSAPSSAPVGT